MIRYWSVILLVWIGQLCAQSPFQLLPEIGLDMQSRSTIVIADTNKFYVVGDHIDTSIVDFEPGIWPHQMRVDYDGNILAFQKLIDSTYFEPYSEAGRPIKFGTRGNYYCYALIKTGTQYLTPYLLDIDFKTATIRRSEIIHHPIGDQNAYNSFTLGVWNEENVLLANSYQYEDSSFVEVIELDTTFKIKRRIQWSFFERHNAPFWINKYPGGYEMTGDSPLLENGAPVGSSSPFYLRTDTIGNILKFNLLNTEENLGSWLADNYLIDREANGDWIMHKWTMLLLIRVSIAIILYRMYCAYPRNSILLSGKGGLRTAPTRLVHF